MSPTLRHVVARASRVNFTIGNSFCQTFKIEKVVNDWFLNFSYPLLWVFNCNNVHEALDILRTFIGLCDC